MLLLLFRWRQWQNQLGTLGKVCPILPDAVESSHRFSLHDITDHLVTYSFQRVHEVNPKTISSIMYEFPSKESNVMTWDFTRTSKDHVFMVVIVFFFPPLMWG